MVSEPIWLVRFEFEYACMVIASPDVFTLNAAARDANVHVYTAETEPDTDLKTLM